MAGDAGNVRNDGCSLWRMIARPVRRRSGAVAGDRMQPCSRRILELAGNGLAMRFVTGSGVAIDQDELGPGGSGHPAHQRLRDQPIPDFDEDRGTRLGKRPA